MGIADLSALDQLYVAYLVGQLLLVFGFSAWFVARLDRIRTSNGDLDLYLNFCFRLFPFELGLYLIWYCADAILARAIAN